MRRIGFLITCVIILGTVSDAQTVTLTLQEDLSSKLPTGTAFTARDTAGKVYHGHVVTRPARLLLRRGSMRLIFDEPVGPVTPDIGATKARYVAIGVGAALIIFQKGGEAKLHRGDTIDVESRRDSAWKSN